MAQKRIYVFIAIAATVFLCFGNTYVFFWRDEWNFLSDLRSFHINYLFQSFNGHIIPIFKTFYAIELNLFGTNTIFYLLINLLIYSIAVYTLRMIVADGLKQSDMIATGVAVLLAAHPINFNHLLWSFQLSQSLFILFQALGVLYFIKFTTTNSKRDLLMTALFVICQNYSFGNGLFFSLVFAAGILFFMKENKFQHTLIFVAIFAVTIAIQVIAGNPDGLVQQTLREPHIAILGILKLMDVNISRMFSVADVLSNRLPFVSLAVFAAFVIYGYSKKGIHKLHLTLFLFWFAVNCVSIPIARPRATVFPHYYSVMTLMPLALIAWTIIGNKIILLITKRPKLVVATAAIVFVGFYLVDTRMSLIFSRRNALNEQAMKDAIQNNTRYLPYDDPYYVSDDYRIADVKDVYIYWRDRTSHPVVPAH